MLSHLNIKAVLASSGNGTGGSCALEYLLSVEFHGRKRVKSIKDKVHALILANAGRVEVGSVDPDLAVDPLQACLVLADEGVWNKFGGQQVEVYAT